MHSKFSLPQESEYLRNQLPEIKSYFKSFKNVFSATNFILGRDLFLKKYPLH